MTEKEKGLAGLWYNPNTDPQLQRQMLQCKELCRQYNQLSLPDEAARDRLLTQILGARKRTLVILPPFYCDYGSNIQVGENFFANHNLVILDGGIVRFGDNVFLGPNCCLTTAGHPLDAARRDIGLEFAKPITVGNSVWIGANVTILPGVTIGDRAVIGAGSVVTRDIPPDVVAVGNPCRVLRRILPESAGER